MGSLFSGLGTGCWYVAEAGSILSLAPAGVRGKYLALWIVSRNLGQLVGGAIKYVSVAHILSFLFPFSRSLERKRERETQVIRKRC